MVRAEAVSQEGETGSEVRPCEVSVGLAGRGVVAEAGSGGTDGPGDCQRDEGGQQVQLGGVGQPGVLEVQAAGLGVAEDEADRKTIWGIVFPTQVDRPSLAPGGERVVACAVGGLRGWWPARLVACAVGGLRGWWR